MVRLRRDRRLRNEGGWVLTHKGLELVFNFLTLKVLTFVMRDTPAAYGEFNLALTGTVLLANVVLGPVNQAYLRYYHTAEATGASRMAGRTVKYWYAWSTGIALVLCGILSGWASRILGLERWTLLAAGLVFLTNRWRILGIEVLEVARARRTWTLQNVGFLALQLVAVVGVASVWAATASSALLAYAVAAAVFACGSLAPWLRKVRSASDRAPSELGDLVVSYGIPCAALLLCQGIQGFADRYILGAWADLDAVGRYVAAYQVCGVPYMFLMGLLQALLVPIAYQRTQDASDARQLWAGDRLIFAGVLVYAVVGGLWLAAFFAWGEPILLLFTRAEFAVPRELLLLLAAGRYLQGLSLLLQYFFAVHQKMAASLSFRVVGAVLTVPICLVAVSQHGIAGAAAGSAIAVGLYLAIVTFGPGGCVWIVRESRRRVTRMAAAPVPIVEVA